MFHRPRIATQYLHRVASNFMLALILLAVCVMVSGQAAAENIKIGTVRATDAGPLFIAQERGYFVAEGIPTELVFFESAQPIAVAAVAGSIDFGVTAPTAGFYSLAGQGALRIIAAESREAPSFHFFAYLTSNHAYQSGLISLTQLAGHSVALTQIGSPGHDDLGLLADKYQLDLKSIRLLPMQSIANEMSAVMGGQADVTVGSIGPAAAPLLRNGEMRVLGWVGDETPRQLGAVFAATKTVDQRSDTVTRFLRAYRKGARDYHDAFTGPGETRQDGPTASTVLAIIAKYTELTADDMKLDLPYVDADSRLDVKDILHQIAWYKAQGMVKPEVDGDQIIDKRFVVPLQEK